MPLPLLLLLFLLFDSLAIFFAIAAVAAAATCARFLHCILLNDDASSVAIIGGNVFDGGGGSVRTGIFGIFVVLRFLPNRTHTVLDVIDWMVFTVHYQPPPVGTFLSGCVWMLISLKYWEWIAPRLCFVCCAIGRLCILLSLGHCVFLEAVLVSVSKWPITKLCPSLFFSILLLSLLSLDCSLLCSESIDRLD